MPLVPLFDTTAPADASHRVTAPGGYESWRLLAYDAKQDLLLLSALHEGCLTDPTYIHAVRRYLRRPTQTTPPLPQNFAAEEFSLYHRGQLIVHSFTRLPPQPIFTQPGHSTFNLTPLAPASTLIQPTLNASHHWIFSNPLVHLSGKVHDFTFDTLAIRDHRFGVCLPDIPCWFEGAVFQNGAAILFQATPTTSWIIEATPAGIAVIDQPLTIDSQSRGPWTIRYPHMINLADRATLTNPRIIDRSPFRLRLLYESKETPAKAFCEITLPPRLASPIFNPFLARPSPSANSSPAPPAGKSSPSHP